MHYNEQEAANWIASNLHSMYVESKPEAIEKSTSLGLTLAQFATVQISRDLVASGALTFDQPKEDDGKLEFYLFNVIDLMYIKDAEKYRKMAAEKGESFEVAVARSAARVLSNWIKQLPPSS